jgi:hypothetical protein
MVPVHQLPAGIETGCRCATRVVEVAVLVVASSCNGSIVRVTVSLERAIVASSPPSRPTTHTCFIGQALLPRVVLVVAAQVPQLGVGIGNVLALIASG